MLDLCLNLPYRSTIDHHRFVRSLIVECFTRTYCKILGVLCGSGDAIAQIAIEKRKFKDYNVIRTARFFSLGVVFIVSYCGIIDLLQYISVETSGGTGFRDWCGVG